MTPSTVIFPIPAPWIFAPIEFKKFAKSHISGSSAAFSMIVVPCAKTDAIKIFSVAPTDGKSKYILFPLSFLALASTKPCPISISAPKSLKPFKCKSMGLLPILQPPGIDILHLPNLDNIGPIIKKDALIFLISSLFISVSLMLVVFILRSPFESFSIWQFIPDNKSVKTTTSSNIGAFLIIISFGLKILATIIGKTEFLAKLIFTSPFSLLPPSTIIFSILSSIMNC